MTYTKEFIFKNKFNNIKYISILDLNINHNDKFIFKNIF